VHPFHIANPRQVHHPAFLPASTGVFAAQCFLFTTYKWKDNGVLALSQSGWSSVKDLTHVSDNGKHLVCASFNKGSTNMNFGLFSDWSQMASAAQNQMGMNTVASILFLFRPKNPRLPMRRYSLLAQDAFRLDRPNGLSVTQPHPG
jgi:hypothetical protein